MLCYVSSLTGAAAAVVISKLLCHILSIPKVFVKGANSTSITPALFQQYFSRIFERKWNKLAFVII